LLHKEKNMSYIKYPSDSEIPRTSIFPKSAFVGFEGLLQDLDNIARRSKDNYPPHNIIKTSDYTYLIELAVAGFTETELKITVEGKTLIICGEKENKNREYIHQGISTKKFERIFKLAENVMVQKADLNDGILTITLTHIIPETLKPRIIEIGVGKAPDNDTHTKEYLVEDR
jgi:molecular chaperone IbpA